MPEAAEVTVASRQLADVAVGRVLEQLSVTHARTSRAQPIGDLARFEGRPVTAVDRHGKWILVSFDGATDQLQAALGIDPALLLTDDEEAL